MADDIDIEEHDVMENSSIQHIFPDLSIVKTETIDLDEYELQDTAPNERQETSQDYHEEAHESPTEAHTHPTDAEVPPEVPDSTTDVDLLPPRTDSPQVVSSTQQDEASFFGNRLIIGNKRHDKICDVNDGNNHVVDNAGNDDNVVDNADDDENNVIGDDAAETYLDVALEEYEMKCFTSYIPLEDWGEYLSNSKTYCSECKILFATINALDFHKMQSHSHLVAIGGYDSDDNEIDPVTTPENATQSEDSKCFVCEATFNLKDELIQHIYDTHLNAFKCKICEQKFTDREEFDTHMIGHNVTKIVGKPREKVYRCGICSSQFSKNKSYIEHCAQNHRITKVTLNLQPYEPKCLLCPKTFSVRKVHNAHVINKHYNDFFKRVNKMNVGKKRTGVVEKAVEINKLGFTPVYKCLLCLQLFETYISGKIHRKKKHPNHLNRRIIIKLDSHPNTDNVQIELTAPNIYNFPTTTSQNLNQKAKAELIQKSTLFKCTKCKVHFTKWALASAHCSTICECETWPCPVCKIKFIAMEKTAHLKQHSFTKNFDIHFDDIENMHLRILAKCPSCKVHCTETALPEHYNDCDGLAVNCYDCEHCNLTISLESSKLHEFTHNEMKFVTSDYIILQYSEPIVKQYTNKAKINQPIKSELDPLAFWFCSFCEIYMVCNSIKQTNIDFHRNKQCVLTDFCKKVTKIPCKLCGLIVIDVVEHKLLHNAQKFTIKDVSVYSIQNGLQIKSKGDLFSNVKSLQESNKHDPRVLAYKKMGYCFKCKQYTGILSGSVTKNHREGNCFARDKDGPKFICKCGISMTKKKLQSHQAAHEMNLNLKDFVFYDLETMNKINPPMPDWLKCPRCKVYFNSNANYKLHCSQKKCSDAFKSCTDCGLKIVSSAYKMHQQFHMLNRAEKLTESQSQDRVVYQCSDCNVCFYTKRIRHNCETIMQQIRHCDVCNINFPTKAWDKHKELHDMFEDFSPNDYEIVVFDPKCIEGHELKERMNDGKHKVYQCTTCEVIFTSRRMKHHCASVKKKPSIRCSKCNLNFSINSYRAHNYLHKTNPNFGKKSLQIETFGLPKLGNLFYKCRKCNNHFLAGKMYRHHSCNGHNRIACSICKISFSRKAYNAHLCLHNNKDFKPNQMKVIPFDGPVLKPQDEDLTPPVVKEEIDVYQFNLYRCKSCQLCQDDSEHVCDESAAKVQCSVCHFFFAEHLYNAHKIRHENKISPHPVKIIPIDSGQPANRKRRVDTDTSLSSNGNTKIFKCACGLCFVCQNSANTHQEKCDLIPTKVGLDCSKCDNKFDTQQLFKHSLKHHKDDETNYEVVEMSRKPTDDAKMVFICGHCELALDNLNQCQAHIKTCCKDPVKKGLRCEMCNLGLHECAVSTHKCSRSVKYRRIYISCTKIVEDGIDIFRCPTCEVHYNTMAGITRHVEHNHVTFYKPAKCFSCNLLFNTPTLDVHKKLHLSSLPTKKLKFNIIEVSEQKPTNKTTVNNVGVAEQNTTKTIENKVGKEIEQRIEDMPTTSLVSKHNNNLFKCEPCDICFVREHAAQKHVANNHHSARKYSCYCGLSIAVMDKTLHDQIHHDIFNVTSASEYNIKIVCEKDGTSPAYKAVSIDGDDEEVNNTLYKCTRCSIHFISMKSYKKHRAWHYTVKNPQTCEDCGYDFTSVNINKHKKYQHEKLGIKKEDFIVVTEDNDKNSINNLDNSSICSTSTKEPTNDDDEGSKSNITDDSMLDSIDNEDSNATETEPMKKLYKCGICDLIFRKRDSCDRHLYPHKEAKTQVSCDKCGLGTFTRIGLETHLSIEHKDPNFKPEDIVIEVPKVPLKYVKRHQKLFVQSLANESENSDEDSVQEENVHFGSRKSKGDWKSHLMSRCDEINKLYKCPECGVHFFLLETYVKHTKRHTAVKNQGPCDECGLAFSYMAMEKHKSLHHHQNKFTAADFTIESPTTEFNKPQISYVFLEGNNVVIKDAKKNSNNDKEVKTNANEKEVKATANEKEVKTTANDKEAPKTTSPEKYKMKYYRCKECKVDFLRQNLCYKHTLNHVAISTYDYMECKICSLNFLLTSLPNHMAQHKSTEFTINDILIEEYEPIDKTGSKRNQVPKIDIYMASEGPSRKDEINDSIVELGKTCSDKDDEMTEGTNKNQEKTIDSQGSSETIDKLKAETVNAVLDIKTGTEESDIKTKDLKKQSIQVKDNVDNLKDDMNDASKPDQCVNTNETDEKYKNKSIKIEKDLPSEDSNPLDSNSKENISNVKTNKANIENDVEEDKVHSYYFSNCK